MQTLPFRVTCTHIDGSFPNKNNCSLTVARFDQLHPFISGNKYFKLKYNLQQVRDENKHGILTMGGAYSNHLAATAFACHEQGITSVAIIRGEITEPLNPTLLFCTMHGMKLIPVRRSEYALDNDVVMKIAATYPHLLFVPEGGNNEAGLKGCKELLQPVENVQQYSHIICSIGTGTTFKGVAASASAGQTVIGIPALKIKEQDQAGFLLQLINHDCKAKQMILFGYAGKGYARYDELLINFMNLFYTKTSIPTDIIYTGKLFQAVITLCNNDFFISNSKVLVIHSGGLQGNKSVTPGKLLF